MVRSKQGSAIVKCRNRTHFYIHHIVQFVLTFVIRLVSCGCFLRDGSHNCPSENVILSLMLE